jgi:hypothetical protein
MNKIFIHDRIHFVRIRSRPMSMTGAGYPADDESRVGGIVISSGGASNDITETWGGMQLK